MTPSGLPLRGLAGIFGLAGRLTNRPTYPRKFLRISVLFGAIGTVANLAARLCGEAKAGQILASTRVADAVENIIDGDAVEPLILKGFPRPMPAVDIRHLKGSAP
jgi:hypothetical protein